MEATNGRDPANSTDVFLHMWRTTPQLRAEPGVADVKCSMPQIVASGRLKRGTSPRTLLGARQAVTARCCAQHGTWSLGRPARLTVCAGRETWTTRLTWPDVTGASGERVNS